MREAVDELDQEALRELDGHRPTSGRSDAGFDVELRAAAPADRVIV